MAEEKKKKKGLLSRGARAIAGVLIGGPLGLVTGVVTGALVGIRNGIGTGFDVAFKQGDPISGIFLGVFAGVLFSAVLGVSASIQGAVVGAAGGYTAISKSSWREGLNTAHKVEQNVGRKNIPGPLADFLKKRATASELKLEKLRENRKQSVGTTPQGGESIRPLSEVNVQESSTVAPEEKIEGDRVGPSSTDEINAFLPASELQKKQNTSHEDHGSNTHDHSDDSKNRPSL